MSLNVCLIASEAAPFAKTGGLADVAAALTKYLHSNGHDVRLFMPLYARIDRARFQLAPVESLGDLPLEFGGHRYRYGIWRGDIPGSRASVWFVDCPVLYGREGIYTQDVDEHLRFIALTRAALEVCQRTGWPPHVVHANDWHTAFAPLYLKSVYAWDRLFRGTTSVLTIHNIGYQGIFPAARADDVGLGDARHLLHQDDLGAGRVNSLKHGLIYADAITTVSPTYAREILTPQFGMGLEETLRSRGGALTGILNGVDYDEWDPRHDRHLPMHFDSSSLEVKARLKTDFLRRLKLTAGQRTALLGLVSRFTAQKGLELLFDALPPILAHRDLCFVALGSGDPRYEEFFTRLQRQFPHRVVYHRGYDDVLAHWIEAASDMFVMPSAYEPCGLNQMYSLRYGTIPIVRRTGGLADSVQLFDPATGEGTGIVFDDFNSTAMSWALNAALDLYARRHLWARLVANAMAEDFSWDRQGAEYVALYRRLLE